MKRSIVLSCLFLLLLFATAGSTSAEPWHTANNLIWSAMPDECYAGLGVDYPGGITPGDGYTTPVICPEEIPNPDYIDPETTPDEPEFLKVYKKTNDSYIWALTQEGNSLWFASAANVKCTTAGVFLGELSYGEYNMTVQRWMEDGFDPETGEPTIVNRQNRVISEVCEHGDSMVVRDDSYPYIMGMTGDWRPSKLYRYVLTGADAGLLRDITDDITGEGRDVFDTLTGIRCAGSHNGVVFFAGGSQARDGVYMFAFDEDGQYLGYNVFSDYRTIRKMVIVNNRLYTGVAATNDSGQVLCWTGNSGRPFRWQVVGRLSGCVRELTGYVDENGQTRLVVNALGIFVSPPMRWGRLFWWNAWSWDQVWRPSDYEPNLYTRSTYGGGDMAQLGEWVYWGTMHIPYHALYMELQRRFGGEYPEDPALQEALYYNTHRATSIWRGRNLGSADPEIQLLYGEAQLGAWNGETYVPTDTGWTPLSGPSGFGNPNNNYCWTMQTLGDHLFVGTMDQSLIQNPDVSDLFPPYGEYMETPPPPDWPGLASLAPADIEDDERGADMWRFDLDGSGTASPTAEPEFTNGGGNLLNYGIRCLIASDDGTKLYFGTANPASLMENGGWELRELVGP